MIAAFDAAAGFSSHMQVYAEQKSGVDVTEGDQIEYNKWFAATVSANRCLSEVCT